MACKQSRVIKAVPIKPATWLAAGFLVFCLIALACAPIASADEHDNTVWTNDAARQPIVVPDTLYYYNPLSTEQSYDRQRFSSLALVMNTTELALAADNIRNGEMSISQRILNHQWLSYHSGEMKMREGNKALTKLFQMGMRTYWNGIKASRYSDDDEVPFADSNGNFLYVSDRMDYRLRLSKSKVRFLISYDF